MFKQKLEHSSSFIVLLIIIAVLGFMIVVAFRAVQNSRSRPATSPHESPSPTTSLTAQEQAALEEYPAVTSFPTAPTFKPSPARSPQEQIEEVQSYQQQTATTTVIVQDRRTGEVTSFDTNDIAITDAITDWENYDIFPDRIQFETFQSAPTLDYFRKDQYALDLMEVDKAWQLTGDKEVIVAVIDGFFDVENSDLKPNIKSYKNSANNSRDVSPPQLKPYTSASDRQAVITNFNLDTSLGHGTNVAGIISAATNNNKGIAGVGKNVKTLLFSVDSKLTPGHIQFATVVNAINDAARQGAQIINLSLGAEVTNCNWSYDPLYNVINTYDNILFVIAAGNGGEDSRGDELVKNPTTQNPTTVPAGYSADTCRLTGLDNIMTVGASNANDQKTSFSNYSSSAVHVFAPGENIASTFLGSKYGNFDYSPQLSPNNSRLKAFYDNDGSGYALFYSGTSQAAPNVAGVASLVLSTRQISPSNVKKLLIATADKKSGLTSVSGGRVNAYSALSTLTGKTVADKSPEKSPDESTSESPSTTPTTPTTPTTCASLGGQCGSDIAFSSGSFDRLAQGDADCREKMNNNDDSNTVGGATNLGMCMKYKSATTDQPTSPVVPDPVTNTYPCPSGKTYSTADWQTYGEKECARWQEDNRLFQQIQ